VVEKIAEAPKPRLRGVSHQWAFVAFAVLGSWLVLVAPSARKRSRRRSTATSVIAMFGVSALYHRHNWISVAARPVDAASTTR